MICRVFIAEDEPPILRDIIQKVESLGPDFLIVGYATNGEDAIHSMRELKPDLLIADINMPIIDGLSLIELVKKERPETVCIILSGYQDFEYARRALKSGVKDYIIKPLAVETLKLVINSAKAQIEGFHNGHMRSALYSIINHKCSEEDFRFERLKRFDLLYLCMNHPLNRVPVSREYHEKIRESWRLIDLERVLYSTAGGVDISHWVIDGSFENEKIVLIGTAGESPNRLIEQIWNRVLLCKASENPRFMTGTYGSCNANSNALATEVDKLRNFARTSAIFGEDQLLSIDKFHEVKEYSSRLSSSAEKMLVVFCQNANQNQLSEKIRMFLDEWRNQRVPGKIMERYMQEMLSTIVRNSNMIELSNLHHTEQIVESLFLNNKDAASLQKEYLAVVMNLLMKDTSQPKMDYEVIVRLVCSFIETKYSSQLTLRELAQQFGLSESHLCKLFKKYKDESPIDYLLKVRIEKAKNLMEESPHMMFKDIAEIVGFSDQYYFSRVFRNQTGYSPSEYKALYQNS